MVDAMESGACRKFVIPRASLSSIYSAHRILRFNGKRPPIVLITDKTCVNVVKVVPMDVIIKLVTNLLSSYPMGTELPNILLMHFLEGP